MDHGADGRQSASPSGSGAEPPQSRKSGFGLGMIKRGMSLSSGLSIKKVQKKESSNPSGGEEEVATSSLATGESAGDVPRGLPPAKPRRSAAFGARSSTSTAITTLGREGEVRFNEGGREPTKGVRISVNDNSSVIKGSASTETSAIAKSSSSSVQVPVELSELQEYVREGDPEEMYELLSTLGKGAHGVVYRGMNRISGEEVAIKKVKVAPKNVQEVLNELKAMGSCSTLYCIEYYGSYYKDEELWVVMQLFDAGSLDDILALKLSLSELQIAAILLQVLPSIYYLHHERSMLHRDIKCGNLLVNKQGKVRLADFGISRSLDKREKAKSQVGSPFWMAPELISGCGYDQKADIWALGITVLEMTDTKHPFWDMIPMAAMFAIVDGDPPQVTNPEQWSSGFQSFLSVCLEKEPDNRPDCKGLMRHPWFLAQTQGMYKEDDVNDENMDEFEGKVSAETIVQHIVGKRDHEGTGKSGGVVTSSGRIVSSTVRASSGEVALSPRELTRENSTGPSMGASLNAKKQAATVDVDEIILKFKFPDGSSQRLLVTHKDTKENICHRIPRHTGMMTNIDLQYMLLMFNDPVKENPQVVADGTTLLSLIKHLTWVELKSKDVLFEFRESPDTESFLVLSDAVMAYERNALTDYNALMKVFFAPNLSIITILLKVVPVNDIDALANALLALFQQEKQTSRLLKMVAMREVSSCVAKDLNNLFRGSSVTGKLMSVCFKQMASDYIAKTLQPVLLPIFGLPAAVELDPNRIKSTGDLKKDLFELKANIQKMEELSERVLIAVFKSLSTLPMPLRQLMREIQKIVSHKYRERRYMVVSSFLFLRFICPAIVSPTSFGITSERVQPHTARTLTILSKVMNNLATGRTFQEHTNLKDMNSFLLKYTDKLNKFFDIVLDVRLVEHDIAQPLHTNMCSEETRKELTNIIQLINPFLQKVGIAMNVLPPTPDT